MYLKTSPPTWAWDLDRIENIEASDNVVALLVKEMGKLNAAPRMALESLACFGSCVKFSVIHILSQDIGLNIRAHLKDLEEKGYVRVDDSSSSVQFCHDNIQQAAVSSWLLYEKTFSALVLSQLNYLLPLCAHLVQDDDSDTC